MANLVLWSNSTDGRGTNPVELIASTALQNLASTNAVPSSSNVANSTEGSLFADIEFLGAMATAPTATGGDLLEIRVIRTVTTGLTDFQDSSTDGGGLPIHGFVGSFQLAAATCEQRLIIPKIEVPPLTHRWHLTNRTTAALQNTTDNVFRGYFYSEQVTTG